MDNLETLTASEAAKRIVDGDVSPVALLEACLEQIRALDGEIAAWIHVDEAGARATARAYETDARKKQFTGDPWFCAPWSSIGVPAISLPAAVGADGLPHAIQLVASTDGDADLLGVAAWCEHVLDFASAPIHGDHSRR